MASPTFAEVWTQIGHVVHQFEELDKFCNANSDNWNGIEDSLQAALEGEYTGEMLSRSRQNREALSRVLSPTNIRNTLVPGLLELARVIGTPARDPFVIMRKLREYMDTNSESVNSGAPSYGDPSGAGGNTGDGDIQRLTVDKYGENLEGLFSEDKTATCTRDQNQVDEFEEVFLFEGEEPERDFTDVQGSGMSVSVSALSARGTASFVQNPSFSTFSGTAPTTGSPTSASSVTDWAGWTLNNTNAEADVDTVYRNDPDTTTAQSIRFTDNNKADQVLKDTTRARFQKNRPVYVQVAVYRESNCDGTFTLRFGGVSKAVSMSGLTNSAWNIVSIDLGTNNYFESFSEADLDVELELSGRSTGSVYVDDLIVDYFTNVDGTYYVVVGGPTSFIVDDEFTWTDTIHSTRGIIQYWFWRAGLGWLNADNSTSETISDP